MNTETERTCLCGARGHEPEFVGRYLSTLATTLYECPACRQHRQERLDNPTPTFRRARPMGWRP